MVTRSRSESLLRSPDASSPLKVLAAKGYSLLSALLGMVFISPAVWLSDIERHASNVLAGLFSLGGSNDVALIEELIQFDNCFDG